MLVDGREHHAERRDAPTLLFKEEYVSDMGQKSKEESCAPTKDVQTMHGKEEYVSDMVQY